MLEYDGPANDSVIDGTPIRFRHPKSTTPVAKLDASKARERGGIRLPDVVVAGLKLNVKLTVEDDEYPDTSCYGDWRDSERDADKIRKAKRDGYLVIKRRNARRNEYDTWVSSEKVVANRIAKRILTGLIPGYGGYIDRTLARGPANEDARKWQRRMYETLRDDEIGAVTVTVRLYLNGTEIVEEVCGAELGSYRDADTNLAGVAADILREAKAQAATAIADLRQAICRCTPVG